MKCFILLIPMVLFSCNRSAGDFKLVPGSSNPAGNFSSLQKADPLADHAWHLLNTGQNSFSEAQGVAGEDMDIKGALDQGVTGKGVSIAVSDSGVEVTHPDLVDNELPLLHRDYSSNTSANWHGGDPYPIEDVAHGTAVTGLAAAVGWNGTGSRGIAPNAKFAAFLFVGGFHTSASSYNAKTLDQVTGNFDIFNYSYGYPGCSFTDASASLINAFKAGVTDQRSGKGSIYVKAAGNDYIGSNSSCYGGDNTSYAGNTNTSEEQNIPYVILTAAMNAEGKIASYSTPGSGLWVSAAGGETGKSTPAMIAPDITGCEKGYSKTSSTVSDFNKGAMELNSDCNYTSRMNGTSSASPVLAGVVALMLEANPNLTWRDVKHILAVTADKVNYSTSTITHPGGPTYNLSGHVYDYSWVRNAAGIDFSNTFGFGRANANRAVAMAKSYNSALGEYLETSWTTYTSGTLSLPIPDNSVTGVANPINVTDDYSIESIQIKVSLTHSYVGDLGLELTSPAGTTSKLLRVNSNIKDINLSDFMMLSNAFYGERSAGTWTIKVVDGHVGDSGTLTNWKIKINGHAP